MMIICDYNEWFIADDNGKLTIHDREVDEVYLAEEVFRVDYSDYDEDEIPEDPCELCEEDYDYSGELDDGSAYVFWKRNDRYM